MNREPLDVCLHKQVRRRISRMSSIVLISIVGLVASYPLVACTRWGSFSIVGRDEMALSALHTVSKKLVWSDEFDGPGGAPPDPTRWNAQVGGDGWGNKQLEYDTNNQNAYLD